VPPRGQEIWLKIRHKEKRLRKRFSYALIWAAATFLTSSIYPKTLPAGSRFPLDLIRTKQLHKNANSKPQTYD
jgi:hypothetical protein